jgi:hypothetical protein
MKCPSCSADNPDDAVVCQECGESLQHNPFSASPPQRTFQGTGSSEGDATGGIIPYKNPSALIAYYLGIASGLPLIGFPLGVAAFILGIKGLRDRNRNPAIKGSVHAGIGIGCGALFALLWGFAIVAMIIGMVAG